MQWEDIRRHAADVAWELRRHPPSREPGHFLCLDCPRDHHSPPYLPFVLPTHIRQHLRAHPRHAIAYWCAGDRRLEARVAPAWNGDVFPDLTLQPFTAPPGGTRMTYETAAAEVALGACTKCNQPFLVTLTNTVCLICGRPPDYILPFPGSGGVSLVEVAPPTADGPPPEPPLPIPVTCPYCQGSLNLQASDTAVLVIPVSPGPAARDAAGSTPPDDPDAPPPPEEVFAYGVQSFLLGAGIDEVDLGGWLDRMGAEPEDATATVGRLVAVRDHLAALVPPGGEPGAPPADHAPDGPAGQDTVTAGVDSNIPAGPSPSDPDREGYVPREWGSPAAEAAAAEPPEPVP